MSGDRQWTIRRGRGSMRMEVRGPSVQHGEQVRVVEASRLSTVEAERDAYREGLEWYRAAAEDMARDGVATPAEFEIAEEAATHADAVLARFPKNETEQG